MTSLHPSSATLSPEKTTTIAIVGGGFSGAAVAYHLAKGPKAGFLRIVVFEPREAIGKGVAYDTVDPVHRINVPAARMSLLPGEPDHFARWLGDTGSASDDEQAHRPDGNMFPRRSVFGDYIHDQLAPLVSDGAIVHVRSRVKDLQKQAGHWILTCSDGETWPADIVVIATTHPAPVPPRYLGDALAGHPRFVADPTKTGALDVIRSEDRVLVVGNGLTSADVIASLTQRGHSGRIIAFSRRGLRSKGHAPFPQEPFGDFLTPFPKTASELLARIRAAIKAAHREGVTWHPVLDQVRAQGAALWRTFSVEDRQRIVRHLRSYWDVHRFRVAPQVENALDDALAAGKLEIWAAALQTVATKGEVINVSLRKRGSAQPLTYQFDAVVVTTGPAHGRILSSQDWLRRLGEQGHLHIDATGLGLACNERSEALSADLVADPTLLIAGPLARGHFGELMGLPQVSEHAILVADQIASRF